MKVILLEDVKGTGKKGQMIDASDGHARNYLIPRKLAVEATKANINELDNKKKAAEQKRQRELITAQEFAAKLAETSIKIYVKSGENGKLFGSVTNKEVAAALEEQAGLQVDKKKIVLNEAIKSLGLKSAEVKLHAQVTAKIKIEICGQE